MFLFPSLRQSGRQSGATTSTALVATCFAVLIGSAGIAPSAATAAPSSTATGRTSGEPGVAASEAITPSTVPATPRHPTVTVTGTTIKVRWQEPDNGGAPLLGYVVTLDGGDRRVLPSATMKTLKRLRFGRHTIQVSALNRNGESQPTRRIKFEVSRN